MHPDDCQCEECFAPTHQAIMERWGYADPQQRISLEYVGLVGLLRLVGQKNANKALQLAFPEQR